MAPSKTATFDSHNPVTNEVIASHEIYSEAAVKAAVDRARAASQEWRDLGFRGRRKVLLKCDSSRKRFTIINIKLNTYDWLYIRLLALFKKRNNALDIIMVCHA